MLDGRLQLIRDHIREDRDSGRTISLRAYLDSFPGEDALVARAFAETWGDAGGDDERDEQSIGPYEIVRELGRGGQGVVYLAVDRRLGRKVALKTLTGLGPGAEELLARFRREAMLASKLEHPGICGVHDAGSDGGVPYIAMRYVEGETLAERLARLRSDARKGEPSSFFSFEDDATETPSGEEIPGTDPARSTDGSSLDRAEIRGIVSVFESIARALHVAHEAGIIHRDIKPGNVMITAAHEPVILDFGLARDDSDGAGPSLTETGDIFGTPAYMSPEQITGRLVRLDRRSDVYSLGVTLYECLTMKRPFEAPTREALYQAIISREPESARRLNAAIPRDLDVVLACAMDKDRDRRYQTAADLAEDLRRVREGEPILARKVSLPGRLWRWSKRRPAAAALVLAIAVATPLISGLGVWYWTHRGDVAAQEEARRSDALERALERGFFELHHGDKKRAITAFEDALVLDPAAPEAIAGLAVTHLDLAQPETALAVVERGEKARHETATFARTKAEILRALDRGAEADALEATAPPIEGALMCFLEGMRSLARGHRRAETSEMVSAPVDFGGTNVPAEATAEFAAAEKLLVKALESSRTARRAYHFELAHARGHVPGTDGLSISSAIERLWPDSAIAWKWIGFCCDHQAPERAVAALRRALALGSPDPAQDHFTIGTILTHLDRPEDALTEIREAIRLRPGSAHYLTAHGHILNVLGRFEEAAGVLAPIVAAHPENWVAQGAYGRSIEALGRFDDAIAAYRRSIEFAPPGAAKQIAATGNDLGIALKQKGAFPAAVAAFRASIERDPTVAGTYVNLGGLCCDLGQTDEAIKTLKKAIELDPKCAPAHLYMGNTYAGRGDFASAEPAFREAVRLDPAIPMGQAKHGLVLFNLKRPEEALEVFRAGARRVPDEADFFRRCGIVLFGLERLEEAAEDYAQVVRLEPKSAFDQFRYSEILGRLGRHDDQVRALTEAVRQLPDDVRLLNQLAWIQVDPEGDPAHWNPEAALPHARRAVELTKRKSHAILDTLAVTLFKLSRLDEAVKVQEEAVAAAIAKRESAATIAEAKAALDRYRKALEAKPD